MARQVIPLLQGFAFAADDSPSVLPDLDVSNFTALSIYITLADVTGSVSVALIVSYRDPATGALISAGDVTVSPSSFGSAVDAAGILKLTGFQAGVLSIEFGPGGTTGNTATATVTAVGKVG